MNEGRKKEREKHSSKSKKEADENSRKQVR